MEEKQEEVHTESVLKLAVFDLLFMLLLLLLFSFFLCLFVYAFCLSLAQNKAS